MSDFALETLPPLRLPQLAALGALAWVTKCVWSYATSPLRRYPGPCLAGWTNLWRFYHVLRLDSHLVVEKLHAKYGPVVRIGPNILSLQDPSLIKTMYKYQDDWVKTEFYHGGSTRSWSGKVIYNIFGMSDRQDHADIKKPIGRLYSPANALAIEGHVDKAIARFWEALESRFIDGPDADKPCALEDWFLYFAWDVIGDITFSQPFGYVKHGRDFDGTLADSEMAMNYLAVVGQMPLLDFVAAQNPLIKVFMRAPFTTANEIASTRLADRLAGRDGEHHDPAKPDFLDGFIEAQKAYPEVVTPGQIQSYLLINLIAGADTTATTMASVVYFGLKHPEVWSKLEAELLAAAPPGGRTLSYKETRTFPYLDAVVRESMRMHPAVGMPLERYVPASGLRLPDGSLVPAGAIVGINPYIVNRTAVFGEDTDVFRPERWLQAPGESPEAFQSRLTAMNNADLTFGEGSRICCGRHIANLELYKIISTFMRRYHVELVDPEKDWVVKNGWFMRQSGVDVRMRRRE